MSVLFLLAAFGSAAADEWRMTKESELTFEASWEETALPGRFPSFNVELLPADGSIEGGRLVVTVDLVAADMDDPDINEAIAGEDWFAVERFPVATYTSRSIRQAEEMERIIRCHPCNVIVSYINEAFPNANNRPHRHVTHDELHEWFAAADRAIRLYNPDRVIKRIPANRHRQSSPAGT